MVIAPPGPVGVEVHLLHPSGLQILGSSTGDGNVACWRNVVSRDAVPEVRQAVGIHYVFYFRQGLLHVLEKRRVVDVGGLFLPVVEKSLLDFEGIPAVSALGDLFIVVFELESVDMLCTAGSDGVPRGPDVVEEDILAIDTLA